MKASLEVWWPWAESIVPLPLLLAETGMLLLMLLPWVPPTSPPNLLLAIAAALSGTMTTPLPPRLPPSVPRRPGLQSSLLLLLLPPAPSQWLLPPTLPSAPLALAAVAVLQLQAQLPALWLAALWPSPGPVGWRAPKSGESPAANTSTTSGAFMLGSLAPASEAALLRGKPPDLTSPGRRIDRGALWKKAAQRLEALFSRRFVERSESEAQSAAFRPSCCPGQPSPGSHQHSPSLTG
jgi:hypothetical protein